ncbi:hypothetical protein [Fluviicola sp.]|uniref:hypothetical protein n=1 Tax=Fluviicola sp. TaxID=1917219 RepID=UPI003D2C73BC
MKKIIYSALLILLTVFSVEAQTPEQVYSVASKEVQNKIDENKKNGENPLSGIVAKHVFKIEGPTGYNLSDLDVHIIEAPEMINYALNLNRDWSKILSVEFECNAIFTLEEIKTYLQKVNVTITKDKVSYSLK